MDTNLLKSRKFDPDTVEGEMNLVALWTRPRAGRIIAGAIAGMVAALTMVAFGWIYCAMNGLDTTAPMRIAALPFLKNEAMAFGNSKGILVGMTVHLLVSAISGAFYGHFTAVNRLGGLIGMGLSWAAFSWVFITNLFLPSVRAYYEAQIPSGVMFFAWIVFGLTLPVIMIFDRGGDR